MFDRSTGLIECDLERVLPGKGHGDEDVLLGFVEKRGELRPAAAHLVGDVAPYLVDACSKACRIAAATIACWPVGTWANAFLAKPTLRLRQVAPTIRWASGFSML